MAPPLENDFEGARGFGHRPKHSEEASSRKIANEVAMIRQRNSDEVASEKRASISDPAVQPAQQIKSMAKESAQKQGNYISFDVGLSTSQNEKSTEGIAVESNFKAAAGDTFASARGGGTVVEAQAGVGNPHSGPDKTAAEAQPSGTLRSAEGSPRTDGDQSGALRAERVLQNNGDGEHVMAGQQEQARTLSGHESGSSVGVRAIDGRASRLEGDSHGEHPGAYVASSKEQQRATLRTEGSSVGSNPFRGDRAALITQPAVQCHTDAAHAPTAAKPDQVDPQHGVESAGLGKLTMRPDTQSARSQAQSARSETESPRSDVTIVRADTRTTRADTSTMRFDTGSARSDTDGRLDQAARRDAGTAGGARGSVFFVSDLSPMQRALSQVSVTNGDGAKFQPAPSAVRIVDGSLVPRCVYQ